MCRPICFIQTSARPRRDFKETRAKLAIGREFLAALLENTADQRQQRRQASSLSGLQERRARLGAKVRLSSASPRSEYKSGSSDPYRVRKVSPGVYEANGHGRSQRTDSMEWAQALVRQWQALG
jgi:hypothetical protein